MPPKKSPKPIRRLCCWCVRITVLMVLIAVGAVLAGVPGKVISGWMNRSQTLPGRVELSDLRWRPGHGWHVEEFLWYSPRDLTRPLVVASSLTVHPPLGGRPARVRVGEGALKTDAGVWTRDLTTRHPIHIQGITGEIRWSDRKVFLESVQSRISGLTVSLNGSLQFAEAPPAVASIESEEGVGRLLRPILPVLRALETFSSEQDVEVQIQVSGRAENPTLKVVSVHDQPFALRGIPFRSFRLAGNLEDRSFVLEELQIRADGDQKLSASSQVNFREQMFDVELKNSLSRDALEALSPFSLDAFLARFEFRVDGHADFTLNVGPSPFRKPGQRVSGVFRVEEGSYRDTFFPAAEFELELDHSHLLLPSFSGTVGAGRGSGEVSGNLELDMKRGVFRMQVVGAADPDLAVSLVGPNVESLIREWEFRGAPPEFQLEVDQPDRETPVRIQLLTRAEKAVWRGTLFHQVRAATTLDEKGLRVRDVTAIRGAHLLEGTFDFPRDLSSCTYTVESSFPLPDILPLLGQQAMDVIRPMRFLGMTRFSSSGIVDLSGANQHDLSGDAELEKAILNWVVFDRLTSTFAVKGQQLDLPDISGDLVDGSLKGDLRFTSLFEPSASFDARMEVRNVDLFELITEATDQATTPYTGTLNLDLEVEGALWDTVETRRASTIQGNGRIEIGEGQLFRIPLLLGLSDILSAITKGFGYASQGDLDADFVIEDGRISTENLFLGGSVMSIAGTFAYELDTQKLDGNVKIQLLKDGLMSDALKVLLWPIRKLIEVSLTGTLDNPDWRPRNLPKELFGK